MGLAMVLHEIPTGGGPPDPDPETGTYVTSQTDVFQMPNIPLMQRGDWYTDSTFGTIIQKISDISMGQGGETYALIYEYATHSPISKDGTYIILFDRWAHSGAGAGYCAIFRVSDGVRMTPFFSMGPVESEFNWDPNDDNVGWFMRNRYACKIEMPVGTITQLWTVTQQNGTPFTYLCSGAEGRPSNDFRWHALLGIRTPRTVATTDWIMYDRLNNSLYSRRTATQYTDAVKTTPLTGQFVGTGDAGSNADTVLYDRDLNFVRVLHRHASHGDLAVGSDGEEYLVYMSQSQVQYTELGYPNNAMGRVRLSDGSRSVVPGRVNGTDKFPTSAVHISGIVSKNHPDWVLVSHYTSTVADPIIRPGDHEIWLQNFMTGDVKRIAHNHNFPVSGVSKDYYAETQATCDWSGNKFLFKSNWGTVDPNKHIETYMVTGTFW